MKRNIYQNIQNLKQITKMSSSNDFLEPYIRDTGSWGPWSDDSSNAEENRKVSKIWFEDTKFRI